MEKDISKSRTIFDSAVKAFEVSGHTQIELTPFMTGYQKAFYDLSDAAYKSAKENFINEIKDLSTQLLFYKTAYEQKLEREKVKLVKAALSI
jgi:hypothetical protein